LAGALVVVLGSVDAVRAAPPRSQRRGRIGFRLGVAVLHLLQPLVRTWGRVRSTADARRELPSAATILGPPRAERGVLVLPVDGPRAELASAVVANLRRAGLRVLPTTGWEAHDARILASSVVAGDLVTSAFPEGCVQLCVRRRPRRAGLALLVTAAAVAPASIPLAGVVVAVFAVELVRGWWRTGAGVTRVLQEAAA